MKFPALFLLILALLSSCKPEENTPAEYYSIIGSWVADSSYSLGYNQSMDIDEHSISIYVENTLTQKINNIIDIQADTGYYLNGDTLVDYYILYRDELGLKKSTAFSYDFKNDVIRMGYHLYDSNSGSYYGSSYLFIFRRK